MLDHKKKFIAYCFLWMNSKDTVFRKKKQLELFTYGSKIHILLNDQPIPQLYPMLEDSSYVANKLDHGGPRFVPNHCNCL